MAKNYYKNYKPKNKKTYQKHKSKKTNNKTIRNIVIVTLVILTAGILLYAPVKNYINQTKLDTNISTSEEKKGKYIVDISNYFATEEDDKFVGFGSENGYSFIISTDSSDDITIPDEF